MENFSPSWFSIKVFKYLHLCIVIAAICVSQSVHAETIPPAQPTDWKSKGLLLALNDPSSEVFKLSILHKGSTYVVAFLENDVEEFEFKLLKLMSHEDENVRFASAKVLGSLNRVTQNTIDKLAELLEHENHETKLLALSAVQRMGPKAKMLAPKISELVNDPDQSVRSKSIQALCKMGPAAEAYASILFDALQHPRSGYGPPERLLTADAMKELESAVIAANAQALMDLLKQKDKYDMYEAEELAVLQLFSYIGNEKKYVEDLLLAQLDEQSPEVLKYTILALGFMGIQSDNCLMKLRKFAQETNNDVSATAKFSIGMINNPEWLQVVRKLKIIRDIETIGSLFELFFEENKNIFDLGKLFDDPKDDARGIPVFFALRNKSIASKFIEKLDILLNDREERIKLSAAKAICRLDASSLSKSPHLGPTLAEMLGDKKTRSEVIALLKTISEPTRQVIADQVSGLLNEKNEKLLQDVLILIVFLGPSASRHASKIAPLLISPSIELRGWASIALGAIGPSANPFIPDMVAALEDVEENHDKFISYVPIFTHFPELVQLLVNHPDSQIGENILHMLDDISETMERKGRYPEIEELLKSPNPGRRFVVASALAIRGQASRPHAPALADLLIDEYPEIRKIAVDILESLGPLDMTGILAILNQIYRDQSRTAELRFLSHLLAGGRREIETMVQWLGRPAVSPIATMDYETGVYTLDVFYRAWPLCKNFFEVREDLSFQITEVIRAVSWDHTDLPLLKLHAANLADSVNAPAVRAVIDPLERTKWRLRTLKILFVHLTFWLVLIFVYPRSSKVQATFFWNPWIRRLMGLGYIGILLTWIPFLRTKLLSPFRQPLLSDAALEDFSLQAYFTDSEVSNRKGTIFPIIEAIPEIKGQVVLIGESGFGKTMFLRYLVHREGGLVVYLQAKRCAQGVVQAIQKKLLGKAKDPDFLRTLIYIGAFNICIDGLNEVDADTRAKINDFAERNPKVNMILATQPLAWNPPSKSAVYVMQPLSRDRIEKFLLIYKDILPADASVTEMQYEKACRRFLEQTFRDRQSEMEISAIRQVLSNPMDLTIVAQMLANEQQPDLFNLQKQQYSIMASEYERLYPGQTFPLKQMSEQVYRMRLTMKTALPVAKFLKELLLMERYKMVLRREYHDSHGEQKKEWFFRHDKIMDYFIVQAFIGKENERPRKHLGDSRYRGVYLMLAVLLPLEAAAALREQIINYAVDTKDHSVSDNFVQLFRKRKAT